MNRSALTSLALASTALVWIMSGVLLGSEAEDKDDPATQSSRKQIQALHVEVMDSVAQPFAKEISLQGVILPHREVELRMETSGRVARLNASKGQRLTAGSSILVLDSRDQSARLERAKAELSLRTAEHNGNLALFDKNLLSDNQLKRSAAQLAAAKATIKQLNVALDNASMQTPFNGILDSLDVEPGAYVNAGETIGQFVDDSYLLITTHVPQQHIDHFAEGMPVKAALADGSFIQGRVSYLAREANADTRTYRLEAKIKNQGQIRFFGQSTTVVVALDEKPAHQISPALLELSTAGELQIKTVNENNEVTIYPIEILQSRLDAIWITGLPNKARIITIGQGFVSKGERVEPVFRPSIEGA